MEETEELTQTTEQEAEQSAPQAEQPDWNQAMQTLLPGLRLYAQNCGLDAENLDFEQLSKKLSGQETPDGNASSQDAERAFYEAHLLHLEQQGNAFRERVPGFDLRRELCNPEFVYLTSPQVGLDVATAFSVVHSSQIQQAAVQSAVRRTAEQIANALASGSLRPEENSGHALGPMPSKSYAQMTRAERETFKKQVMDSQFSGKKVYPG